MYIKNIYMETMLETINVIAPHLIKQRLARSPQLSWVPVAMKIKHYQFHLDLVKGKDSQQQVTTATLGTATSQLLDSSYDIHFLKMLHLNCDCSTDTTSDLIVTVTLMEDVQTLLDLVIEENSLDPL